MQTKILTSKDPLICDVIFLIQVGKLKQTTWGCVSLRKSGKLNPELGNLRMHALLMSPGDDA